MGGYDPKGREIVADFARVMNYLGTSYGVLRKEKCTGDPVRRLGNDLLFQQLAESNLEMLSQSKVKKIVTICPHCVRTIQEAVSYTHLDVYKRQCLWRSRTRGRPPQGLPESWLVQR